MRIRIYKKLSRSEPLQQELIYDKYDRVIKEEII